jgi:hypothetical protein
LNGWPGRGVLPVFSGAYCTPRKPDRWLLLGMATNGGRSFWAVASFSLVNTTP